MGYCSDLTGNDLIMHAKNCHQCINQIINDNLPLAYKIQCKYSHSRYYDKIEFEQEGRIALHRAVCNFDPSYDTKFSTLAYSYILNGFRNLMSAKRNTEKWYLQHDCDDFWQLVGSSQDYDRSFEISESLTQARTFLAVLDSRSKEIIMRRHGIEPFEKQTLQGVADSLGLSKERIRQIETKAYMKMRKFIQPQPA